MKELQLACAAVLSLSMYSAAFAEIGVTDDSIRPGTVNVQTGPALGIGMLIGASAVFDSVNKSGGVQGRMIGLKVADDGYEPDPTIDETLRNINIYGLNPSFTADNHQAFHEIFITYIRDGKAL